jgi:hypothetical protein
MLLVRLLPDFCIDAEVKFVIVSRSRGTSVNVMEGSHLGEDFEIGGHWMVRSECNHCLYLQSFLMSDS